MKRLAPDTFGSRLSGAWARLLTGRLDDDHMPSDTTSTGTPILHELRTLLQGDPMSTGDAE